MATTRTRRPGSVDTRLNAPIFAVALLVGLVPSGGAQAQEDCPRAEFTDRDAIPQMHKGSVDCAAAEGITVGFPDATFRPALPVPRDQMASFVARMLEAAGVGLPAASDQGLTDVAGNVHQPNIEGAFNEELVRGTSESAFTPRAETRRDQMTTLLVRALQRLQTMQPERSLSLDVSPDPQEAGEEVRAVATVTDAGGEPLENVTVSFAGGGAGGAVAVPDSNVEETTAAGQADYEFLSNTAGTVTVEACAPAVDGEVCDTGTVSFN